jgi:hypothetical protein
MIDSHKLPARKLVNGERAMQFSVRGKSYWCPLDSERCVLADSAQVIAESKSAGPTWASRSPDGQWDAFVWNYNVYVRPARATDADPEAWRARPRAPVRNGCDAPTMPGPLPPRDSVPLPPGSIALTTDGTTSWGFGLYQFGLEVARVELDRFHLTTGGVRWSPDSKRLLVQRDDLRGVRTYPLYSSTSNQPVDHSYFYAVPGDTAVLRYNFYTLDVASRSATKVEGEPIGALGSPSEARWGKNSDELYVVTATRGQKACSWPRSIYDPGSPARSLGFGGDLRRPQWRRLGGREWRRGHLLGLRTRRLGSHLSLRSDGTLKNQSSADRTRSQTSFVSTARENTFSSPPGAKKRASRTTRACIASASMAVA